MSISVVFEQMIIIFILILIGISLFREKMLSESTSRQLSGLIVNITNPAVLLCSAFDDSPKIPLSELGIAVLVFVLTYVVLFLFAYIIPIILRIPQPARYSYRMLTIFGNVSFIGIPLSSAVLGSGSLIFVSLSSLIFNILIYTYGLSLLRKAAIEQGTYEAPDTSDSTFRKIVNVGTISAVLTIILYVWDLEVPTIISDSLNYAGRATTLLSMLVLGVSVAQMNLKEIFSHPKLYLHTAIRHILLPIGFTIIIRNFIDNELLVNTAAIMLAVPAGNMPLMLSKQLNADESTISQGIILTTVLSLITIPIVTLFIS
ncbi:MAG: AEC family transporter [Lachnospiraceae bacterium]|nr:AEC family transporter [Lachnospiraceae bacterium]